MSSKLDYLIEYLTEEIPQFASGLPFPVKPLYRVLRNWMRQDSVEAEIERLRSKYYDGIVFAAICFWFDPFYQLHKHKVFYSIWKWYRKVFYRPRGDDMIWYSTQRVFKTWMEEKRWYEKS